MINDAAYTLLFYAISIITIVFALAVTMSRNLLRAAVCLMMVLLTSACLYIMLDAEFLAGIQVLVYVGGIVVLIVFAIMLTRSAELLLDRPPLRRKLSAGLASLVFAAATIWIFWTSQFPIAQNNVAVPPNNTEEIGLKLLDYGSGGYILPFEIISILLLAAIIGGIVVARKTPPPEQPFTTGGDLAGEADFDAPHTQRPETMVRKHL
jgi:NADH:ubiquinone oxidoreductase subunit 6 (chain J)